MFEVRSIGALSLEFADRPMFLLLIPEIGDLGVGRSLIQ
jgi:hypothetical protein